MDISQYEQYFIYDDPVQYISQKSLKRKKEIEIEIANMDDNNLINDVKIPQLKIEYENLPLLIRPVRLSEYLNFHIAVNCLSIDKNKIPDPKVISMSYLDFLFHLINNDTNGIVYGQMLIEVFRLCLGLGNEDIRYLKNENGKINLNLNVRYVYTENNEEKIGFRDEIIDKQDFDNIRNIILYQNIPDYDDTYIDPKVEQVLKEAQDFMNKNKKKMCSFEDQLICVMLALKEVSLDNIKKLTIRKFSKILERYDYKFHYGIYKQAEMSGMVSFKKDIDHWMSELKKNKYSDVAIEYGQFKNKIESAKT